MIKTSIILFVLFYLVTAHSQQTIDKLNSNQLKLPKETISKALSIDATGQVKSSSTSSTELGYLSGVSSSVQDQIDDKANDADAVHLTGDESISGIKTLTGKLVTSSTVNASIPCPVMTQTQRDAIVSPVTGDCVFNSNTSLSNIYDGSLWKAMGGSGGGISLWLTATGYAIDDVVIQSNNIYICLIAHTSGTFATDLAALKWLRVSTDVTGATGLLSLATGGTNKSITPANGSIVYSDADSFELLSGTSGQTLQSNGSAAPSFVNKSISAKAQNGTSVTAEEIQAPNNLLTQTDTNKHLNETGNKNILVNPSFEHSTFSTGWTNSIGTLTQELTSVIDGLKSAKLVLSAQTMSLTQSSPLYQAQFADGIQGLASVRIKSNVALKVCSIQAGTVSTSNCVTTNTDSKWGLYKIPFVLGDTSNGISIASSGSVSGTVYIDDAFVGAVDLKQDVSGVRKIGSIKFTGCAGNWSNGSTTLATMGVNNGCTYTTTGQVSAPTTMVAGFRILGRQAGSYKVDAYGRFGKNVTITNSIATFVVRDTTNSLSSYENSFEVSPSVGASLSSGYVGGSLDYTTSGDTSYEIFGKTSVTASSTLDVIYGNGTELSFDIYYYPPSSSQVYTSNNADTNWASCGHTTSSFTGFGTVTAIETQCKREGSDLLMKGKVTAGATPTAVEARVSLPIWQGAQLVSANTSIIPSLQVAGDSADAVTSTSYFRSNTLIEPSVSYVTFGLQSSTLNAITKVNGNSLLSNSAAFSFTARIPIEGWNNSNIIIGSFSEVVTSPGVSKPKTCHYAFGGAGATLAVPVNFTTGTAMEVVDTCGAASPPAFNSAGSYINLTFANGTFSNSSYMYCDCVAYNTGAGPTVDCSTYFDTGDQTWVTNSSGGAVLNFYTTVANGTPIASYINLRCEGSAP